MPKLLLVWNNNSNETKLCDILFDKGEEEWNYKTK